MSSVNDEPVEPLSDLYITCKSLRKRYDASIIDKMPKELIEAFKSLSNISYQNCAVGRPVLLRLIHNYYNKDRFPRPVADFISGPKNLTVHWSEQYRKQVYIFGEYHVPSTNCTKKFPEAGFRNTMSIQDYIEQLYRDPYVFIDTIAEFPAIKMKTREYDSDITNFKPYYPVNYSLYHLFEKLKYCVNPNTRHADTCQVGRVHFFDVRFYNYINFEGVDRLTSFVSAFHQGQKASDDYLNQTLKSWKKTLNTFEGYYKPDFNIWRIQDFFNSFILSNPYNLKELNQLDQTLRPILELHIRSEIRKHIKSSSKIVGDNIEALAYYDSTIFDKTKTLPSGVRESFNIFTKFLTNIIGITVDVYTLCRIFKKFNLTKEGFHTATKGDQPDEAYNIIIYGGDQHAQRCRRFLNHLGFEEVAKTGQAENANPNDSCIDMKHIPQPFFGFDSIDDSNKDNYEFNYDHTYDFEDALWDPMDTR